MRIWAIIFVVGIAGCGRPAQDVVVEAIERASSQEAGPRKNIGIIGKPMQLGNAEITPIAVEIRQLHGTGYNGRFSTGDPVIAVTFTVKNISEGQVYRPTSVIEGEDNFGNILESIDNCRIDGDEQHKELLPGDTATVILGLQPKIRTATRIDAVITTRASNAMDFNAYPAWTMAINVSQ